MSKNFREVLKDNQRKTILVICTFLLLYVSIGFLADIVLHAGKEHNFSQSLFSLITFQQIPIFTLCMLGVGLISVYITFKLYDKIMLWGTDYIEINPDTNPDLGLVEKQLFNIIEELKIAAGLNYMPKVYLIDADYMNAFASGYSEKSAMVAITRGLIEKLNRSEIQAVMAHELSHIKHMDIKITLFVGVLSNIMLLVLDWLFHIVAFSSGRREKEGNNATAIASLIILVLRFVLPIITLLLTLYLSRTRELMADAGAVKLTRDKSAMASALLKIHNNYEENNYYDEGASVRAAAYIYNPMKSFFKDTFSTHPSIEKRLSNLGVKDIDVDNLNKNS